MIRRLYKKVFGKERGKNAGLNINFEAVLNFVIFSIMLVSFAGARGQVNFSPDIPDPLVKEAYEKAAAQNVLPAVNNKIFYGYFSVCADGVGFGYGNTYPSLDGHQMSDALLFLGQVDIVKANWDYVKTFQLSKGELPIAIIPAESGKLIGPEGFQSRVHENGGLYQHWVPKDPLRALAGTTYIQNADIIFRYTQDKNWLIDQLPSVNLTADYLAAMIDKNGTVGGAGYYVERPTRVEYDGVTQGHAADAYRRLAQLNTIGGNLQAASKYQKIAEKIERNFQDNFWKGSHFAEYRHPDSGYISSHGFTDADWTALATNVAKPEQEKKLWPLLKNEKSFYYNGMPTGIATKPSSYQQWETTYADNQDLAAMGRVWYIEAWARANMKDAEGLMETIRRVSKEGRDSGYYWRERYNAKGGYGAKKYNEYPANLIRIMQRFVFGIQYGLDGTLEINPVAPASYWEKGFGQTIHWNGSAINYKIKNGKIEGQFSGSKPQALSVQLNQSPELKKIKAVADGKPLMVNIRDGMIYCVLPPSPDKNIDFTVWSD
jgi:hypothetical protein